MQLHMCNKKNKSQEHVVLILFVFHLHIYLKPYLICALCSVVDIGKQHIGRNKNKIKRNISHKIRMNFHLIADTHSARLSQE